MPGELHWEVGFFGKPKLRPELRTDGKKKDLPDNLKDIPEFQDEKGTIITEEEDAVTHTPPDPLWPSGILSVVVHQIVHLQLANIKGTSGSRKGREYEPAKSYGESTEEEGKELPTSYCKILLNDELVSDPRRFYQITIANVSHRYTGLEPKHLAPSPYSTLVLSDSSATGVQQWSP
jgi:hypothetical protein